MLKRVKKIHELATLFGIWSGMFAAIVTFTWIVHEVVGLPFFRRAMNDILMVASAFFIFIFLFSFGISILLSLYIMAKK